MNEGILNLAILVLVIPLLVMMLLLLKHERDHRARVARLNALLENLYRRARNIKLLLQDEEKVSGGMGEPNVRQEIRTRLISFEAAFRTLVNELEKWPDFRPDQLRHLPQDKQRKQRNSMDTALLISGISAGMQAIQTWLQFRDSQRAAREFQARLNTAMDDPAIALQAEELESIVPAEILQTMLDRARKCWERYHEVLKGNYLPEEVNEATEAVKKCICRELARIVELNGAIPDGELKKAYGKYCAT